MRITEEIRDAAKYNAICLEELIDRLHNVTLDPKIEQVYEAHAKRLAEWMVENGFKPRVENETFEELLSDLSWQIDKNRNY